MLRGQDDPGFYPLLFGTPGITLIKSSTNSVLEWVMIAKVRKYTLCYFFGKFYVELVVVILFFHKTKLMVNAGNQKKPGEKQPQKSPPSLERRGTLKLFKEIKLLLLLVLKRVTYRILPENQQ